MLFPLPPLTFLGFGPTTHNAQIMYSNHQTRLLSINFQIIILSACRIARTETITDEYDAANPASNDGTIRLPYAVIPTIRSAY